MRGLFLEPEDGGSTLRRNVDKLEPDYTAFLVVAVHDGNYPPPPPQ
jgi:hypothetical protein